MAVSSDGVCATLREPDAFVHTPHKTGLQEAPGDNMDIEAANTNKIVPEERPKSVLAPPPPQRSPRGSKYACSVILYYTCAITQT